MIQPTRVARPLGDQQRAHHHEQPETDRQTSRPSTTPRPGPPSRRSAPRRRRRRRGRAGRRSQAQQPPHPMRVAGGSATAAAGAVSSPVGPHVVPSSRPCARCALGRRASTEGRAARRGPPAARSQDGGELAERRPPGRRATGPSSTQAIPVGTADRGPEPGVVRAGRSPTPGSPMPMPSGSARASSESRRRGRGRRADGGTRRSRPPPIRRPTPGSRSGTRAWPSDTSPPPAVIEATSMPLPRAMAVSPDGRDGDPGEPDAAGAVAERAAQAPSGRPRSAAAPAPGRSSTTAATPNQARVPDPTSSRWPEAEGDGEQRPQGAADQAGGGGAGDRSSSTWGCPSREVRCRRRRCWAAPPGGQGARSRAAREVRQRQRPPRNAATTAWTRSRTPSFRSTWATWHLTVALETNRRCAISALDRPSAIRPSTSSSRAVSRVDRRRRAAAGVAGTTPRRAGRDGAATTRAGRAQPQSLDQPVVQHHDRVAVRGRRRGPRPQRVQFHVPVSVVGFSCEDGPEDRVPRARGSSPTGRDVLPVGHPTGAATRSAGRLLRRILATPEEHPGAEEDEQAEVVPLLDEQRDQRAGRGDGQRRPPAAHGSGAAQPEAEQHGSDRHQQQADRERQERGLQRGSAGQARDHDDEPEGEEQAGSDQVHHGSRRGRCAASPAVRRSPSCATRSAAAPRVHSPR